MTQSMFQDFITSMEERIDEFSHLIEEHKAVELSEREITEQAQAIKDRLPSEEEDPYTCELCELRLNDEHKECEFCGTRKRKYSLVFKSQTDKIPKRFRVASKESVKLPSLEEEKKLESEEDESDEDDEPLQERDPIYYAECVYSDIDEDGLDFIADNSIEDYEEYLAAQKGILLKHQLIRKLPAVLIEIVLSYLGSTSGYDRYVAEVRREEAEEDAEDITTDDERSGSEDEETIRDQLDSLAQVREDCYSQLYRGSFNERKEQEVLYRHLDIDIREALEAEEMELEEKEQEYEEAKHDYAMEHKVFIHLESICKRALVSDDTKEEIDRDRIEGQIIRALASDDDTSDQSLLWYHQDRIEDDIEDQIMSQETCFSWMNSKFTCANINELTMEDMDNKTEMPKLFAWGRLICADGIRILHSDWENTHISEREFLLGVTELLREINKRIIELNPDWKEEETEIRSLAEIRKEQASTKVIIPTDDWKRLCQEVGQDFKNYLEWEPEALEALQTAAEAYLTELFADSNKVAIHAGRTHINVDDMRLIRFLRKEDRY